MLIHFSFHSLSIALLFFIFLKDKNAFSVFIKNIPLKENNEMENLKTRHSEWKFKQPIFQFNVNCSIN